jgi:hypothetical protein
VSAQNDTSQQNIGSMENKSNIRAVINAKNNTVTYLDKTTNETISVDKFTLKPMTTKSDETISNQGPLSADNATADETLTSNGQNTTSNQNLTAKFNTLQGK